MIKKLLTLNFAAIDIVISWYFISTGSIQLQQINTLFLFCNTKEWRSDISAIRRSERNTWETRKMIRICLSVAEKWYVFCLIEEGF